MKRWLNGNRPLCPWLVACAALLGLALQSGRAEAASDDYSYEFETDFLDGDDLQGDGPRLTVLPKGKRVLLIRPRVSFLNELFQTAEIL